MQKLTDTEISGKQRSLREFVSFCQKLLTMANLRSERTKTNLLRKRNKEVKPVMHARPQHTFLLNSVNLKLWNFPLFVYVFSSVKGQQKSLENSTQSWICSKESK